MFLGIYNAPPDSEVEKELRGDVDDRADVDKLVKRPQSGDDEAFSSLWRYLKNLSIIRR